MVVCAFRFSSICGPNTFLSLQGLRKNAIALNVCVLWHLAFAELQIDMSEVANDILSSSGLPFRDYSNYSVRVLFAGDKWQPYVTPHYVSHFQLQHETLCVYYAQFERSQSINKLALVIIRRDENV